MIPVYCVDMVKYHNSCYRSCAHRQSLLRLQLREDEAYSLWVNTVENDPFVSFMC